MKKILILLLFIPFLAFGQTSATLDKLTVKKELKIGVSNDSSKIFNKTDSLVFKTKKAAFSFDKDIYVKGILLGSGGTGEFAYTKTFHPDSSLTWYINPGKLLNIGYTGSATALHMANDGVSLSSNSGLNGVSAFDAGQAYLFGEVSVNLSSPYINIGESGTNEFLIMHGRSINIVGESYNPGDFPERVNSLIIDSTKLLYNNGIGGDLFKIDNSGKATSYGGGQLGNNSSNSTFETDGTLVYNGNATVWEDVNLAGLELGAGASTPDLVDVNNTGLQLRAFDGTAIVEQLYGTIELPHSYKEGSNITMHVHWMPTTTETGNVRWKIDYKWVNAGDVYTNTVTTQSTDGAASGTAWDGTNTDFSTITGTGKTISSHFVFRLYRDPTDVNDTYAADAAVIQIGIHYEKDTNGSRTITTK